MRYTQLIHAFWTKLDIKLSLRYQIHLHLVSIRMWRCCFFHKQTRNPTKFISITGWYSSIEYKQMLAGVWVCVTRWSMRFACLTIWRNHSPNLNWFALLHSFVRSIQQYICIYFNFPSIQRTLWIKNQPSPLNTI